MKKDIYSAQIIPTTTDGEYQFGEIENHGTFEVTADSTRALAHLDDIFEEYIVEKAPELGNIRQNFVGHGITDIVLKSTKAGEPVQVWWAADAEEDDE